MIKILRRLFGTSREIRKHQSAVKAGLQSDPLSIADTCEAEGLTALTDSTGAADSTVNQSGGTAVTNRYFELSAEIEQAKAERDYIRAIRAARETFPLLPAFVRSIKQEYGKFDIITSHAVHTAPTLMAVTGDRVAIGELRMALEQVPELHQWLPVVDQAEKDAEIVDRIVAAVDAHPGLIQSKLKHVVGTVDGTRPSLLSAYLEKAKRIQRVRKGSSYHLYPKGYEIGANPLIHVGSSQATRPAPLMPPLAVQRDSSGPAGSTTSAVVPTWQPRSRCHRAPSKAQILNLSGPSYVRLPMAPPVWEASRASEAKQAVDVDITSLVLPQSDFSRHADAHFSVEGSGWSLATKEKLPPTERPDPLYRNVFRTAAYTFWLDPRGQRVGYEAAPSVLRVTDRTDRVTAESGLAHNVYRAGVSPDGSGILFLSREGMLHGYTPRLDCFLEEPLDSVPEYQVQAARFGITPQTLKNHIRCLGLSSQRSCFLVTMVDEAWCLSTATSDVLWGLRLPAKEGWTRRVSERSVRFGTSSEVEAALRLMELELPICPEDITRQFRKLAMRWHPDRNPSDPSATKRFQELGAAMELLTGADLSQFASHEVEHATYERILSTSRFAVPSGQSSGVGVNLTLSMVVSENFASDWIYAANIGRDGRAYLASYTGKVVVVSGRGIPERIYDIGAVTRHIADIGEHLYIVTDTRLYVLSGDRLEALIDVYGQGDLVVAEKGFGLIDAKSLSWFTPEYVLCGRIRTKDPIRRALSTPSGLVIETRQHRAIIKGAPSWW